MAIVDAARSSNRGTAMHMQSRQFDYFGGADEADHPVMIEMQSQLLSNQARRHTLEDAAHIDGAMGTDSTAQDFIIRRPISRQRLQGRLFQCKFLNALGIEFRNHRFNEGLVLSHGLEIEAASPIQRLTQATFEVAMGRFDAPVLMGHARIVPGRLQAIMVTDRGIHLSQLRIASSSIAISRAQTIGAMLLRHTPTGKQGILQALRQADKAFATLNHLNGLPTAVRQSVVIQNVLKGLSFDRNTDPFEVREV